MGLVWFEFGLVWFGLIWLGIKVRYFTDLRCVCVLVWIQFRQKTCMYCIVHWTLSKLFFHSINKNGSKDKNKTKTPMLC